MPPEFSATDTDNAAQGRNCTQDSFLGGRITISQPKSGFRAGIDSVLLAAALPQSANNLLELGAGAGAAACCALSQLPDAHAVLIEKQADMHTLLCQNLTENRLNNRSLAILADILTSPELLQQRGLTPNHFDCVFANPPFFDANAGTKAADKTRALSNHMPPEDLEVWVKRAAMCAHAGGSFLMIHHASALANILAAMSQRFGDIAILPILPRPGEPANRILVRGIKGSRAPLKMLAPLILHNESGGQFSAYADEIFKGNARLDW